MFQMILWSASPTMYTPVPYVALVFQLTKTYLIKEMTSDEPDPDVDFPSSIFQLSEPPDWAFRAQVQLVLLHGACCVCDVKVGPKETHQCRKEQAVKNNGQNIFIVSQMVENDVKYDVIGVYYTKVAQCLNKNE